MQRMNLPRARQFGFVALLVFVAASTGCSKFGKVTGKVYYIDGQPLGAGQIYFVKEGSKKNEDSKTAELQSDGSFTSDSPIGTCKVYLVTDTILGGLQGTGGAAMPGGMPAGAPGMSDSQKKAMEENKEKLQGPADDSEKRKQQKEAYRELPPDYTDPDKSPLKYDIHKGSQEIEIKLEKPANWTPGKGKPGMMGK